MVIIQKALGRENIDEVIKLSEDYKKSGSMLYPADLSCLSLQAPCTILDLQMKIKLTIASRGRRRSTLRA